MVRRLIRVALDLIEKNGGCRGVNLRQIAAGAECAHTNAYNYFPSLEALFWAALEEMMDRQSEYTKRRLARPEVKAEPLRAFLQSQAAFAQKHPALYRLFWMEPLTGEPPPRVIQRLDEMRSAWVHAIAAHTAGKLAPDRLVFTGELVHGYFHGEICKLIGRRAFVPKRPGEQERIVANTLALIALVAASGQPRPAARPN